MAQPVEVRLLGPPQLVRGGTSVRGPRGRKGWALLARLALSDRPLARSELAGLLFSDAADPLGALRWTLAEVRRALGLRQLFRGDPLQLPDGGLSVDVRAVAGNTQQAVEVSERAGELLVGWDFPGCPEFEAWLAAERRRAQARVESQLRAAAMHHLAAGDTKTAIRLAERAVSLNPLDEALQELLVRSLARSGDRAAAERQAAQCERLVRETLGSSCSPALRAAVMDGPPTRTPPSPTAAAVLIDSGQAAIHAGAIDAGILQLRRAITAAEDGGQRATALLRLGAALVHGLRGGDEEGAIYLHEAAQLSRRAGELSTCVSALRELAFIDVQAGRVPTAAGRLQEATELAGSDDHFRCGVLAIQGMHLSDRGDQRGACEYLEESIEAAQRSGDRRQVAWSLALLGRSHFLEGDLDGAARFLDDSIERCRRERWLAFLPFPLAVRAEAALAAREPVGLPEQLLEEAFALSCELGDPCWEGMGGCGLARLEAAKGDVSSALGRARDAHQRCVRHPDRYVWIEAWVLLAVWELARRLGRAAEAADAQRALADLAARTEQPYFQSRLARA